MTDIDITAIRQTWLNQCGPCDAGLPMPCSHPQEDYRPVMSALLAKVAELTAERDNLVAYNRAVKGANDDLRAQLTAANRRADGLANDLRSAIKGNTAWANQMAGVTDEPGPEVTKVYDRDGDTWIRSPQGWRYRTPAGDGDPWVWDQVAGVYGPMVARAELPTEATR